MHRRIIALLILVLASAQTASSQNSAQVQLVGVGTTTPLPVYSRWFQEFQRLHPDLHLIYLPYGSGKGIEMVASGTADFGGSDAPLTDKELAKAKMWQFATLLGALVPIYNVANVAQLKFSPRALAGIYLGTITRWNDPIISTLNPGTQLPDSDIAVIHSADGRGSTYIWSDYLSKVNVTWRTKVGRGIAVKWPVGAEGDGYGNIAKLVRETPNSIGYVEFVVAVQNRLTYGKVQNAAGEFVGADSASMTGAAASAAIAVPSDFRSALTNSRGEGSYPIPSCTWVLISQMASKPKLQAMKGFLRWALGDGQTYVEAAGFARLPSAIIEQELKALEQIP